MSDILMTIIFALGTGSMGGNMWWLVGLGCHRHFPYNVLLLAGGLLISNAAER